MKRLSEKFSQRKGLSFLFGLSSALLVIGLAGLLLVGKAQKALAACSPTTSYGTDTISLSVNTTATYTVWVRLLSPDGTNNQMMMSVDNGTCTTFGKTMAANTWTWVDTSAGTTTPVTMSLTAGTHNVVFTGNQQGVEFDTVQFLSDATCTPNNTGDINNCVEAAESNPAITISAPTSGATVSGASVTLSAVPTDPAPITSVQFQVDGTNVGAADTTSPYSTSWNSTTVADGSHTIKAIVTDIANATASATETVTVANNVCNGPTNPPSNVHDTDTSPLPANKVDLAWTAGSAAANCTLQGYNVYRGTTSSNLVKINTSVIPTTQLSYSDTTVAANTNYFYQVTAIDGASHESTKAPTTPLSITTGQNCTSGSGAPTAPTALHQTANNYTTNTMAWTASTISNGCTISGYHVFRVGTTNAIGTTTAATTTFTDTGADLAGGNLSSGTGYSYFVQAFDSGGNNSPNSSTVLMATKTDDQAPTKPANVTATTVNTTTINVGWGVSTDLPNPGATGVSGYEVFRCTGVGCTTFSTTALATVSGASSVSYSDGTGSPGTTYGYVVAACDNVTPVPNCDQTASLTIAYAMTQSPPPQCTLPPSTPPNFVSTGQTMTTISLSWSPSTPAANCTISGYEVERGHAVITTVTSGTTYTDPGLSPGTPYVYTLIAVDNAGHLSTPTSDLSVSTSPDTQAPTDPTNFTVAAPNSTTVNLNWTVSQDNVAVNHYNIYRNSTTTVYQTVAQPTSGTTASFSDTNVTPSTTYTYDVQAVDNAGNKSNEVASTPASITTPAPSCSGNPSTPTGFAAGVVNITQASFSWNASTAPTNCTVAGYNIFENSSTTPVNTSLITATTYTVNNLSAATNYTFTVQAVINSSQVSSVSGSVAITTSPSVTTLYADIYPAGHPDGHVNFNDLALFIQDYITNNGKTVQVNTNGDIAPAGAPDGHVNFSDLSLFAQYYPIENGT